MENDTKIILEKLEALEARIAKIELGRDAHIDVLETEHQKKLSIKEFLLSKKPPDDVKKVLAIGYYLGKFDHLSLFNINDLESAFERAKEKKPINVNDKVNMNIRNGHMEESSDKKDNHKAWYLTNTGEAFIQNDFKSKAKKS
jgi:hypothetical protein